MYNREELVNLAKEARSRAYSPYSDFCVGAALLCDNGQIYTGANVENSSYGGAICAERVAFCTAVHNGEKSFKAIAIIGAKRGEEIKAFCAPCGICRQFMSEFCGADFEILLYDGENIKVKTMAEMLPESFDSSML